jgi:F-type H+-transporting ATPase subunit b
MNLMMGMFIAAEGGHDIDPARSKSWIWPEQAELIYGSIASILIFAALFKFAGPAIKQAMADRTNRIQTELDESVEAKTTAEGEAAQIRQAAGDIDAERQRLFAEADAQAEQVLADGRVRLEDEVAELEARSDADIATAAGRIGDELRAEIARLANAATDRVLADGVDDVTQNELVESFISKVGAS